MVGFDRRVLGLDELFVEIENALEVFEVIAVGFSHQTGIDECKDDFAEVVGRVDVPSTEDCSGKETVSVDRVVAQSEAEFLSRDMEGVIIRVTGCGVYGIFAVDLAHGVGESVGEESICLDGVSTCVIED